MSNSQVDSKGIKAKESLNAEFALNRPYVILVSIDGFRHDYIKKYSAKNLEQMKAEGASTVKMFPSFPSKTFPNHYSIVTGMLPANHGLVSNEFYSRSKRKKYAIRNKKEVQDSSWYGGVPLWSLAEQQGMLSASYFWVGSEANILGARPTYYKTYNGAVSNADRVKGVLDWLDLPKEKRPHFITLYFSIIDDYGHRYGPESDKMFEAVGQIDSLMGVLRKGIEETKLPVFLAVTSDHGMSEISRGVILSELVDLGNSEVYYSTPTMIYTESKEETQRIFEVLDTVTLFKTYKREDLPQHWKYNNSDRVGDILIVNEAPLIILAKPSKVSGGTHGFDPFANDEMSTIFLIEGPDIKKGFEVAPFQNIHIYPFLASILGLEYSHQIDGEPSVLKPMIQ
ncbi:MAG: ectonucleotide pyrophosphatase/phosphodiesterase [Cyclobacteriaceae bacterium]